MLPPATRRLDSALDTGTPVLRRAIGLADRLGDALAAVERLASDPLTLDALERLLATVQSVRPTLRYVAPSRRSATTSGSGRAT